MVQCEEGKKDDITPTMKIEIDEYRKIVENNINKTYKKSAALFVIEEQYNACEFDELRDESKSEFKSLKLQQEIQLHKENRDWDNHVKTIVEIEVEKFKNKLIRSNNLNTLDQEKYKHNIQTKVDKNHDLNSLKCISNDLYDDVFGNLNYIHSYRQINSVPPIKKQSRTLADLNTQFQTKQN